MYAFRLLLVLAFAALAAGCHDHFARAEWRLSSAHPAAQNFRYCLRWRGQNPTVMLARVRQILAGARLPLRVVGPQLSAYLECDLEQNDDESEPDVES